MPSGLPEVETQLDDLNIADPKLWDGAAFWPLLQKMRAECPVHYCSDSSYGPYWSLTRYEDIMAVETNHEIFSSASKHGGVIIHDDIAFHIGPYVLEGLITMDPPRHEEQRKAVSGIVARPNLEHFSKIIRERTCAVLDSLSVDEVFDWVPTVSIELTTQMLATLFDIPFEDRHKLTRWSNVATSEPGLGVVATQEERVREIKECLFYFTKLWRERRTNESGFDLVSMLSQNPATEKMHPMNFLGNVLVLIVGGNDTTRNTMSGAIRAFHENPDQWRKLKDDRTLMENAVSEIIRWQTPIAHMRRTALDDTQISGKIIKKGDKVVMWYASGNRDETIFSNSEAFDIERKNARRHLSFGMGIHRCMGRRLAELQVKILLEEMMQRWDRIELAGTPDHIRSNFVNGYSRMPVRIIP
ncbi:MAG: cytochrome P450 [Hyphococcus sp.]|nr:MAG: cytochrome P450 [Marinicaulis sp.]